MHLSHHKLPTRESILLEHPGDTNQHNLYRFESSISCRSDSCRKDTMSDFRIPNSPSLSQRLQQGSLF